MPPHSPEAEKNALGCVLLATEMAESDKNRHSEAQQEQNELLFQLNPRFFYLVKHQIIFRFMWELREKDHALNLLTLSEFLRGEKKLDEVGGVAYLAELTKDCPSIFSFPTFLNILKDKSLKRLAIQQGHKMIELGNADNLTPEVLQGEFSELAEKSENIGKPKVPYVSIITPSQARAFVPDPTDYLIGQNLVNKGSMTVIGGKPGIGKSRLSTTLAVAGARGHGSWMGYPVNCQFRTFILQEENTEGRLKNEFDAVPPGFDDWIRVTDKLPYGLCFDNPEFRRELKNHFCKWPYECLVIDPWNKVSSEDGQSDYAAALQSIRSVFFGLPKPPALIIVAHLRKSGRDGLGRPKSGRELLDELSGSLALGSDARAVFTVQQVTASMDDPRIVFDVAKANDCPPEWLREYGSRSAWNRANAAFERIENFDWEAYENPGEPERRKVTEEMLREVLPPGKALKKARIASALSEKFGVGESTVFRAIDEQNGYLRPLLTRNLKGELTLK